MTIDLLSRPAFRDVGAAILGVSALFPGASSAQTVSVGLRPFGHLAVACAPVGTTINSTGISNGTSSTTPNSCSLTIQNVTRDWLAGLVVPYYQGNEEAAAKIKLLLSGDVQQIKYHAAWSGIRWGLQDTEETWTLKGYREISLKTGTLTVVDVERDSKLLFGTSEAGSSELLDTISLPIVDLPSGKTVLMMPVAENYPDKSKRFSSQAFSWQARNFHTPSGL